MVEFLTAHGGMLLFYLFAALAVVAAVAVITLRNPMYGAIGLLVTFLAVAALFVLRHAEFLAMVQIFVYGGGVMVLFLFVIMLVNLHKLRESSPYGRYATVGVIVAALLIALFGFIFVQARFAPADVSPTAFVSVDGAPAGNSQAVAWVLYTEYLLPFEIASLSLLVAMIGAVVLGRRF